MSRPTTMEKIGATPAKLALIGLLSAVLLAVVVPQLRGKSSSGQSADSVPAGQSASQLRRKRPTRSAGGKPSAIKKAPSASEAVPSADASAPSPRNTAPSAGNADPARSSQGWTQLPLEELVKHDPMAAPAWYVAAATKPAEEDALVDTAGQALALAELEKQGANIVMIAGGERVATIGAEQLRIGDRIEGFRVIDITTQGVVLTEIGSE